MNEIDDDDTNQIPDKCEVCGRQDETVRFVTYPYIFSIVVVTFQRAFVGCWCRTHRIQRWFAASAISSIFGWLGFPFGIIFTPFRLLQLARGGILNGDLNAKILRTIGNEKHNRGDTDEAIRCYEASLRFSGDTELSEKLRTLYRSRTSYGDSKNTHLVGYLVLTLIPVGLFLVGIFVGLIDYVIQWVFSSDAVEVPILLIVILQAPFVILTYFCVVLTAQVLKLGIKLAKLDSLPWLYAISVAAAVLFVYGNVSGETYGIYLNYFINGYQELPGDGLNSLISILTHSGLYIFRPDSLAVNFAGNMFLAALLLLSFIFSIIVFSQAAKEMTTRERRIQRLQYAGASSESKFQSVGWIGLLGVVGVVLMLFVATPQKSVLDGLEAFEHTDLGYGHQNAGEYDQAISEFKVANELRPQFPLSYIGLGYTYYFSGNLARARESFENALALMPNSAQAHSGLGWTYLQGGENDLAAVEFNNALMSEPQLLDGHLGLGWSYLNQFEFEESRREFEYVRSNFPQNAEAYYGLGTLNFILNDYQAALDMLDEALNLNPNLVVAYFYRGSLYYRMDMYADAEREFQSALGLMPDYYSAIKGLGDLRASNYQFEDALDFYDQAITIDPAQVDAYTGQSSVLIQIGELDQAISLLESYPGDDVSVSTTLAFIQYLKEEDSEGGRLIRQALMDLDQLEGFEKAEGYAGIAAVDYSLSNFLEAENHINLAAESYPAGVDAGIYLFMAQVASAKGDFEVAGGYIQHAKDIGHSEFSIHMADAGNLINQEMLSNAEDEIDIALQIDERSSNAHAMLSFIHFLQGDFSRAAKDAETAIQLNPYNSNAHSQLAFAYLELGMLDNALQHAQEAVRINPLVDSYHYILGRCYMESDLIDDAIREFEKFLDKYWDRAYIRDYKMNAERYLEELRSSP